MEKRSRFLLTLNFVASAVIDDIYGENECGFWVVHLLFWALDRDSKGKSKGEISPHSINNANLSAYELIIICGFMIIMQADVPSAHLYASTYCF